MSQLVLLGPQRRSPNVAVALARLGVTGPLGAITAGWQERADEISALQQHLKSPVARLDIYRRAESVFERDPDFFQAYRARQNRLKEHQRVYRLRLNLIMRQCLETWKLACDYSDLPEERAHALEMVRELDRHHLQRVVSVRQNFDREWNPLDRPQIRKQREELKQIVASCSAILLAGGHVAVLLNRLRLLGLESLFGKRPLIAWSGGAMVLGSRVVLFHDKPPQGPGFAEVLEAGLDLYRSKLVFPDATSRLDLKDPDRLAILARRFHPQQCLLLDPGTAAFRMGDDWRLDCRTIDTKGILLNGTNSQAS